MAKAAAKEKPAPQAEVNGEHVPPATVTPKMAKAIETTKERAHHDLVSFMKTLPDLWQKMDEKQQQRTIERAAELAGAIVNDVATTMASRGFECFDVNVGKITIDPKSGLKCDFALPVTQECIDALLRNRVNGMVLVTVNRKGFDAGKNPPKPDVVGSLKLPKKEGHKDEPEQRQDAAALAAVGRGADGKEEKANAQTGELPPKPPEAAAPTEQQQQPEPTAAG